MCSNPRQVSQNRLHRPLYKQLPMVIQHSKTSLTHCAGERSQYNRTAREGKFMGCASR